MDTSINASFEKGGSIKKEVYSTFNKSRKEPRVPINLQKFISIDSDLGLMTSPRLGNELRLHKMILHFNDSLEGAIEAGARITGTNKSFYFKSSANKSISST